MAAKIRPTRLEVAPGEGGLGRDHPFVLVDDVLRPAQRDWIELGGLPGEHRPVDVAQRAYPGLDRRQGRDGPLAVGSPRVVLGRAEGARHARVGDDKDDALRQGHQAMLQRAAVEEDGRAGDPTADANWSISPHWTPT